MVGVDLRDEERHQRIHAEVPRVADNNVPGGGKGAFDLPGHRGVEAENTTFGPRPGVQASTTRVAAASGIGVARRQGATLR